MFINRNTAMGIILIFSLAFNAAVAGISAYYLISGRPPIKEPGEETPPETDTPRLHRRRWEKLHLSEEQQEILERRREHLKQELTEERSKAREIQREFFSLLEDPDSPTEEIERVADEFHRNQQAIRRMLFDDLLHLREVLDEDQRRAFGRILTRRYIMQPSPTRDSRRTQRQRGTPEEEEVSP